MSRRVGWWAFNSVFGLVCFRVAQVTDDITPLGALFVVLLVQFAVMKLRERRRAVLVAEANSSLEGGRYVAAREQWRTLQRAGDESAHVGVALACIGLWQLDEARDALRTASAFRWPSEKQYDRQFFAIVDVLSGARVWPATELVGLSAPVIALVNGVARARSADWRNVLATMPPETVRPLSGQLRAIAEAVRAWALRETGGEAPPIDFVGVLGETGPEAVRKYWPEFADFLESAAKAPAAS